MELSVKELEPGIFQASLSGRFDADGMAAIRSQFQNNVPNDADLLVVEMSGVDMLASSGIRLLLSKAKSVKAAGGKMVIAGAQTQVEYPMTISGVDTVIRLFPTVEKAIASCL